MTRPLALIPVLLFAGCLSGSEMDPEIDAGPSVDPSTELEGGVYQIESNFDLTAASVLPEPAVAIYETLVGLREDPANTLVGLLSDASVPIVDDLYDALPGALASRLEGWMNSYIDRTPLGEVLDMIIAHADSVLTRFTLVSEIELELAHMCAPTQHRLREFRYSVGAATLVLPIGDLPAPPFAVSANVQACVHASEGVDAQLTLDGHTFGLPYGQYVYAALEMAVQETMGAGLREVIADTIDCAGLAQNVAGKCVLGICVGHRQQLEQLCEAGVDQVVSQLRTRIEAMSFDAIRLETGTADMHDAVVSGGVRDGVVDRLEAGTWDASVDFGLGPRSLPARFRGTRM